MKMRLFTVSLIFLLFLASQTETVNSFQNCNQTPFCKRARSRKPGSCNLIARNVSISVDGDLTAKLIPKGEGGQIKPLALCVSVSRVGIMRVKIKMDEEDPASSSFDIVPWLQRFEARIKVRLEKAWTELEVDGGDGGRRRSLSTVVNLSEGFEAVLRHEPFEVYVREKAAGNKGRIVVSFNSNGLFDFEELNRSISFDVSFYGSDSAYGITERNALTIAPTKGPGVEEEYSKPYTWFNIDVFEYWNSPPPYNARGFYGLSPFMAAHGRNGSSGFLWLNAAEMQIDVLGNGWDAAAEDGNRMDTIWTSAAAAGSTVDTFFLVGPKPKDVVRQYTAARGRPAQPLLLVLTLQKYWLILLLIMIISYL
ncbi:Glycoside hydrolase, family 31 [Corchorus capsularis]|uniref:Glycoside hydrolase, family 31 n=1 Tax=Corchorus capsularis TaxID=210143 RepID=A0A1R3GD11_COCAP|nr:Glycoside hydrolase, family 31 [Corchorus capsularis]